MTETRECGREEGRSSLRTYKRIRVNRRGGPDVLELEQAEFRAPSRGEIRLRVLSAPVSLPDVEARYGRTPFPPRLPFTPGYAVVGTIDALGDGIEGVSPGERFAALTAYGGYTEYIYLRQRQLIPVPDEVDPVKAAPVILNYIVAFQCLHRVAKVQPNDQVLLVGASGGIGSALLQLGRLAGLEMYALASKRKHDLLEAYDAFPIDYRAENYMEIIRDRVPGGLNAVFDGVGGAYIRDGFSLLRPGGLLVSYANPFSLRRTFSQFGNVLLLNLVPNGRSAAYYSTGQSHFNPRPFLEDWATLFEMLKTGKIDPVIAGTYPLEEAAAANTALEAGQIEGNLVLNVADNHRGQVAEIHHL